MSLTLQGDLMIEGRLLSAAAAAAGRNPPLTHDTGGGGWKLLWALFSPLK